MDKDNMSNTYDNNRIIGKATAIMERLQDIQNIVQLFEVSLACNHDDENIIRSVQVISKMVDALIGNECRELIQLCSDYESI